MIINNGASAREWLAAWGDAAYTHDRIGRVMADQFACAMLCGERLAASRDGHLEAVEVLRSAREARIGQ